MITEYLGKLDFEADSDLIFDEDGLQRKCIIAGFKFAAIKLKCYPCMIRRNMVYYYYNSVMKYFKTNFNHDIKNDIIFKDGDGDYSQVIEIIPNRVLINIIYASLQDRAKFVSNEGENTKEPQIRTIESIHVLYEPGSFDAANEIFDKLEQIKMVKKTKKMINMICIDIEYDKNDMPYKVLDLHPIAINDPNIKDLKLHYGSAFNEVHNKIMNELNKEESHGLILLHGLPGTGKTNYIRYLINIIKNKKIIYIPPEMVELISQARYLPFMLEHTDSILIIEDAENIIKCRSSDETTTQSVANLLNLSDGLLGDSLRQPIIATFNCELNTIDPALLRKGRLIAEYEFGKLSVENAQKMSDHLGYTSKVTEPMVLADIYCQDK